MGDTSFDKTGERFPTGEETRWSQDRPADQKTSSKRAMDLARLIESQIIPRLMLAHEAGVEAGPTIPVVVAANVVATSGVEHFARIVVEKDLSAAFAYVETMRRGGISLEIIFLDLLAPTARHLGEQWDEDTVYFSDVAVGLSRLHQLVRELSPEFQSESKKDELGGQALFLPMPGESHTFGLVLVVEFFRRAGWDVWGWPLPMGTDLLTTLRDEKFDLVGLSVSCDSSIEALPGLIRDIRANSNNRALRVIVGGPLFIRQPDLVAKVGADATAIDGQQSVEIARKLVNRRC